jgi:hypothetical protein
MTKKSKIWIWVIAFMLLIIILLVSYMLYQKSNKGGDELGVVPDKTPSYGEGNVDANSKSRLKIKFFR